MNLLLVAAACSALWLVGYGFYWVSSRKQTELEELINEIDDKLSK